MSWRTVQFGDFLTVRTERYKPADPTIRGLKRIDKIDFSGKIYLSEKPSNTDMIRVKSGDLVISGINVEKGAVSVYEGGEDVTATIHYSSYEFDPDQVDIAFLKLFLRSHEFRNAVKEQVPGGIKTEIKPKHLLPLKVVIPDLAEQVAIADTFAEIERRQLSVVNEQSHQLEYVATLRQAFLREAMQGKLVPQDPSDEPASVLLEKIKAEKAKLIAERKIKKEKPLPEIKPEEIPFEIPSTWTWCRLGQLLSYGPTNGVSPKANGRDEGIKCLTLTATTSAEFREQYHKFVDIEVAANSHLWLSNGDILIQRGNSKELVGIAAIFTGPSHQFIYPDLMMKIQVFERLNREFIHKVLISPFNREYFSTNAFGAQQSMPKINQSLVLKTLVPLPPLDEQKRIVEKLEKLMAYCDELEANIRESKKYAETLLQVALKEALEPRNNI